MEPYVHYGIRACSNCSASQRPLVVPPAPSVGGNRLLAMLPPREFLSLVPELQHVHLAPGMRICEFGAPLNHVYFPTGGIVSLSYVTAKGDTAGLALVGAEGLIGVAAVMGGLTMTHRAVAQSTCAAYRLPARVIRLKFAEGGAFQLLLLKFIQSLIMQISQTAVCIRHHSIEEQLSRLLLHSLDRMPSNRLYMTHERIASMLGVRRQGVTEAANRLARRSLVSHCRGMITVVDRAGLLTRACECYGVVQAESERLLPSTPGEGGRALQS